MRYFLKVIFFFITSTLALISCTKKTGFENKEENEIRIVSELGEDFKIPSALWDIIEGKDHDTLAASAAGNHAEKPRESSGGGHGEKTEGGGGAEAAAGSMIFAPLRLFLVEKNEGVLQKPRIQIEFPRGGGQIDLSQFTTGVIGSFFFGLEIPEIEGLSNVKVYFISQARKRKIDGEIFGSGCQSFYNITDRFLAEMKSEGLKVNTARNRHVSVLAGHFILTAQKDKQTLVSQLTITDSKNSYLLCESFKESKNESDSKFTNSNVSE